MKKLLITLLALIAYMPIIRAQSAGTVDGTYFTTPTDECTPVDKDGFIRRWWLLDPIDKPNRSNTVFTDSYIREAFAHEYFKDQMTIVPTKDGQQVKVDKNKLTWHQLLSTGYNVHLYRFATTHQKQKYGVIFWAVTIVDSPKDYDNIRLMAGSNSASMWWLNGEEVLIMSGDRRMVKDDCSSGRISLKQGRNILRVAVINGPGMSAMCARFVYADGQPITDLNICK